MVCAPGVRRPKIWQKKVFLNKNLYFVHAIILYAVTYDTEQKRQIITNLKRLKPVNGKMQIEYLKLHTGKTTQC